jgi:hypothetical protein
MRLGRTFKIARVTAEYLALVKLHLENLPPALKDQGRVVASCLRAMDYAPPGSAYVESKMRRARRARPTKRWSVV